MTGKIAVDTNVMLYGIDLDAPDKLEIAVRLLDLAPVICSQNVSEFINVLLKRWKYPKEKIGMIITEVLNTCKLFPNTYSTYLNAVDLANKYQFQIFDAIIVAAALEAGCETLYSEDLQHKQVVEGKLTIINPFV
ncbi:MAG: PIN domain-containing protein [Cyclobacteriaceae bacterium]